MSNKYLYVFGLITTVVLFSCTRSGNSGGANTPKDSSLVNLQHLEYLYTPITFPSGTRAAGIYIYADAPDYHLVPAKGEGFACVDDVARAALVYLRSPEIASDTSAQRKLFELITFVLEMQSDNGYFYNFLFESGLVNKSGATSADFPSWWSWRALQTLTESLPFLKNANPGLATKVQSSVVRLVDNMKLNFGSLPLNTKIANGLIVPEWLPEASGTDQAALMIIGLINYHSYSKDASVKPLVTRLSDGIQLMQHGDSLTAPYGAFLSWENIWHAYGNLQSYALLMAADFLDENSYRDAALTEVDHFYSWLLSNKMFNSFEISKNNESIQVYNKQEFDQIVYGITPMFFGALQAYNITKNDKYADIAGHLAAWLFGANSAHAIMYDSKTGRCYDGFTSGGIVNKNSGAESTVEALLMLQQVEKNDAIKQAMDSYR